MNQEATDFTHERSDIDDVTTEFSIVVPQEEFQKRVEEMARKKEEYELDLQMKKE